MKEIPLGGELAKTLSLVALIDDEDFEKVSQLKWHAWKGIVKSNRQESTFYVVSSDGQFLHRFVTGVTEHAVKVDHRDRNGLNNQKGNLRKCTHGQNLANRPKARKNTTGFKGAYRYKGKSGGFFSIISFNNKNIYLGSFKTLEEAARAYDRAAIAQWGEFACPNFPRNESQCERAYEDRPAKL